MCKKCAFFLYQAGCFTKVIACTTLKAPCTGIRTRNVRIIIKFFSLKMGRKSGHNFLGHGRAGRSHYRTKKKKQSINTARHRNTQPMSAELVSSTTFNSFRIMNLNSLSSHLQIITTHVATSVYLKEKHTEQA